MNKIIAVISFIVLIVSVAWFYAVPSYEPAVALLGAVATIIPALISISKVSGSWLNKRMTPIRIKFEKKKPEVSVSFDALIQGKADKHTVSVKKVWNKTCPTLKSQVIHQTTNIDPYTILLIEEGHHFNITLTDIDGDGNSEVVLTYHCGGHSMGMTIFKVDYGHFLKQIPGSNLGSDWPEIKIEERDHDKKMEIYIRHRNWSGSPSPEYFEYKYVLVDGTYVEQSTHNQTNSVDS